MTDHTKFDPDWLDRDSIERYKQHIAAMRRIHKSVLGPTGRRARGPRYYAIVMCQGCGDIGMTDSAQAKKKRWRCWTCGGCRLPVWADGPTPDEDEIWEVWAEEDNKRDDVDDHDYLAMKGHAEFVRQNGCSVKRQGSRCAWCETPLSQRKKGTVKRETRREMMVRKGAKDAHGKPGPGLGGQWYPCAGECHENVDPEEWRYWINTEDNWQCIRCTRGLLEAFPEWVVSGGGPLA